jgi:hypothetical protein
LAVHRRSFRGSPRQKKQVSSTARGRKSFVVQANLL